MAQARTDLRKFGGIRPDTKITERALAPDVYAAYLFDIRETDTKYGSALKLFYYVFVPDMKPTPIVELNEMVGEYYSNDAKFMRRIANVNGQDIFPLGYVLDDAAKQSGAIRLVTSRSEDGFTRIESSMVLADGSMKNRLMTALRTYLPREFPAQDQMPGFHIEGNGNADEPPF